MSLVRYGIILKFLQKDEDENWCQVFIFSSEFQERKLVLIDLDLFRFAPSLGDAIKISIQNVGSSWEVSSVEKCSIEWLRDVSVFNKNVVIKGFVHFERNKMNTVYESIEKNNKSKQYYIFDDSDFGKVAILKVAVDSILNKLKNAVFKNPKELNTFRVGVYKCDDIKFKGVDNVVWIHHTKTPMVPVYNKFQRQSTFPYVSPTVIYGPLEGIIISSNNQGSLIWSWRLGYLIFPNSEVPNPFSLGETFVCLAKRSLIDVSFGFRCVYEVLPGFLPDKWENTTIFTDFVEKRVYIKTEGKFNEHRSMTIKKMGVILIENNEEIKYLKVGNSYNCNIEFEFIKNNRSYETIIKDIWEKNDLIDVCCRIVLTSIKNKTCYAIPDPSEMQNHRIGNIKFIEISEKLLFCELRKRIDYDNLILTFIRAKIRKWDVNQNVVKCMEMKEDNAEKLDHFCIYKDKVFMQEKAEIIEDLTSKPIVLLCKKTKQIVYDVDEVCKNAEGLKSSSIYINAECVIDNYGDPQFIVRNAADNYSEIEILSQKIKTGKEKERKILQSTKAKVNYDCDRCPMTDYESSSSFDRSFDSEIVCESMISANTTFPEWEDVIEYEIIQEEIEEEKVKSSPQISNSNLQNQEDRTNLNLVSSFPSSSNSLPKREQKRETSRTSNAFYRCFRAREMKNGIRILRDSTMDNEKLLFEMAYKYMNFPGMYIENEIELERSWNTRREVYYKNQFVNIIGIESYDSTSWFQQKRANYEGLVRFYVHNCDDCINDFIVMPHGGIFKRLPPNFQLGQSYLAKILLSRNNNTVKIAGYGNKCEGSLTKTKLPLKYQNHRIVNKFHRKWLRISMICIREATPIIANNVFEIWSSEIASGFVIAEKQIMNLDPLEPDLYDRYRMLCNVEPLPGGPFNLYEYDDGNFKRKSCLVAWRIVVENEKDENMPRCIEKVKKYVASEVKKIPEPIKLDAVQATLDLSSLLKKELNAQNNEDELPEHVLRVDTVIGKEKVMNGLEQLKENLEWIQKTHDLWTCFNKEEIEDEIEEFKSLKFAPRNMICDRRNYVIKKGTKFIVRFLKMEEIKRIFASNDERLISILKTLIDCVGFNRSFVKKTERNMKLLHFLKREKLHNYEIY